MTQKNIGTVAVLLLVIIGIFGVIDPTRRQFNLQGVLSTYLPLVVGALGLWVFLR